MLRIKNFMQRQAFACLCGIIAICMMLCACGAKESIVGVWSVELYGSEQIVEFTSDGKFIDRTSFAVNRYRIDGNNVVTYVEDMPETEVSIPYKVKDGVLSLGEVEYKKIEK